MKVSSKIPAAATTSPVKIHAVEMSSPVNSPAKIPVVATIASANIPMVAMASMTELPANNPVAMRNSPVKIPVAMRTTTYPVMGIPLAASMYPATIQGRIPQKSHEVSTKVSQMNASTVVTSPCTVSHGTTPSMTTPMTTPTVFI